MKYTIVLCILLATSVSFGQICSFDAYIDFPDDYHYKLQNPKIIRQDSLLDYYMRIHIVNNTNNTMYYDNLYGRLADTNTVCAFEIYKKINSKYTQKFEIVTGKRRVYKTEYGSIDTCVNVTYPEMIKPHDAYGRSISLAFFFDVREKGEYVLKGFYHPNCNGIRQTKATNEIYFRIE